MEVEVIPQEALNPDHLYDLERGKSVHVELENDGYFDDPKNVEIIPRYPDSMKSEEDR